MRQNFRSYLGADEREAGYNLSWGSVIAGVVTFIALFFTLSLIGSAIGFGVADPTSNNPLDGVGTGLMIWTIITLALSFLGAGFISGVTARRVGLVHGFLTWGSSVIVMILLFSYLTVGAFSAVGSMLGNVTSAIGSGVETVASGSADAISKSFDKITDGMGDVDTKELEQNVNDVLKDTQIPELQPDYLKNELSAATDDVTAAGKELALHPENSDKIIDDLSNKLEDRAQTIGDAIDEQAIANEVATNTDLSQAEAEQATKNITDGLNKAVDETQTQLKNAGENIKQAKQDLDETIKDARETADDATNATAKASIWGFIAMVISLVIASYGGLLGANFVKDSRYENEM